MADSIPMYTRSEQVANRLTHGIGILLSISALIIFLIYSLKTGNPWFVVSCVIFGLSLILLYTSSTLYHTLTDEKMIIFLRKMDHASIFILIAGTYTPIMVICLTGPLSKALLIIIWLMAITGVLLKIRGKMQSKFVSVAFYLAMGWLFVIPGPQIIEHIPEMSLILIAAGGLSYTIGVVFYAWKRLPYNHSIWHLFVLGGSILHFIAIWQLL